MSKQNLARDQFSFLFNYLIYVFIFDCAGSSLLQGHSTSCGEQTLLSSCSACTSHCCGFSLCGAQALVCVGCSIWLSICRFDPWVGMIHWRREWQPTPVFLPGEFHGQRSLAGYSPWCHKESDMTERLTISFQQFHFNTFKMMFCTNHYFSLCLFSLCFHGGS